MNLHSIRTRLMFWYAAVLAIGLLLFSCATWIVVRRALDSDQRRVLTEQLQGLETYLQLEDTNSRERFAHECEEYSRSLPERHLVAVFDPNGALVCSNLFEDPRAAEQFSSTGIKGQAVEVDYKGHRYLAAGGVARLREGTFRTVVGTAGETNDRVKSLLAVVLCSMLPLFAGAGIFGGYWLSRRALRPVDEITARAKLIGLENLSERLPVTRTGDELQRLTETWNQMLQRLDRSVGAMKQFTADASHELRTPLTIIRLAAEKGLSRHRQEGEYRQALAQIARETETMTLLVENLLFLAQNDSSAHQVRREPVEMHGLIQTVLRDFEPSAQKKSILLECPPSADGLWLVGDAVALTRLFRILVDNAIKYTPAGGHVSILMQEESPWVSIDVIDDGMGVPEEDRQRIFERFYRVETSRSRESGGYGLGLAIASVIAQQHGGSITVKAAPRGGSAFSVRLPGPAEHGPHLRRSDRLNTSSV